MIVEKLLLYYFILFGMTLLYFYYDFMVNYCTKILLLFIFLSALLLKG